jgi:UDP-N-acetylmuramoylalanine--D-glutamate ligase
MLLIYWKWKVGNAIVLLCDFLSIPYEVKDDSDKVDYTLYKVIIPSPGVPSHHDVYKTGKVKSELDFAYEHLPPTFSIIAVTGTDGKSTTSWIMYELLRQEFSDEKVYLSGNFDIPFSATILEILKKWQKDGHIVVEVSSFMAYSLDKFRPDYSIFTNFKPDHLNWHRDLQDYLDAKMHIIWRTKKKSIINEQIIVFAKEQHLAIDIPNNIRIFSQNEHLSYNFGHYDYIKGEDIIIAEKREYTLSETHFSWLHNAMNILSASIVASEIGISSDSIRSYLREITGLPHRLEKIGEKDGIIFVEDSKSTSAQSLEAALGSYGNNKNLFLIVWWSDKWDSFGYLWSRFHERVKAMVCIGATKELFADIAKWEDIPYLLTDSLSEGVTWLYRQGSVWDVLMLSPGCAGFWLFRDYLDRAEKFRDMIKKLP